MLRSARSSLLAATALSTLLLSACAPEGAEGLVVGPEGGVLEFAAGAVTLTVPEGAVDEEVELTVGSWAGDVPSNAATEAWELGPEGLEFAQPVGLEIRLDGFDGDPDTLVMGWLEGQEFFPLDDYLAAADKLGGDVDHCTIYLGVSATDEDGDGYVVPEDCDDGDASIHPAAQDICDGLDNDCDGQIDEPDDPSTPSCGDCDDGLDNDLDGLVDSADPDCANGGTSEGGGTAIDADCDGYTVSDGDCDDHDPSVNPGAPEVCDGLDNDCDGQVDENEDVDGDGELDFTCDECSDGLDNDGDGLVDADDPDCAPGTTRE